MRSLISLSVSWLLVCVLSAAVISQAEAQTRVRYTVNCCLRGTSSAVTEVKQWDFVDVVVYVQQEAAPGVGQGVFSAYCDVQFDATAFPLNFAFPGAFKFVAPYTSGPQLFAAPDSRGVVRSGAFSGSFSPIGVVAREVFRLSVRADKTGTYTFTPSVAACTSPMEDTLVYGQNGYVPKDHIDFKGATITVK